MMSHSPGDIRPQDDISLIDLVKGLARSVRQLLQYWKGIGLSILISTIVCMAWYIHQEEVFPATLSFILNDDNTSQLAGFASVFGQLGIPMSSGKYNVDKLMEIAKSRRIVSEALFKKSEVEDQEDFMANHLLRLYDLPGTWGEKRPEMQGFRFVQGETNEFNEQENWAFKNLYQMVVGNANNKGLLETDYGRTDYIMYLHFTSIRPTLSMQFVNDLYDGLESFFYNNANKRQQENFDLLMSKRDSISSALTAVSATLTRNIDKNLAAVDLSSGNYSQRLRTDQLILQSALAKAEEHLNIAEISMRSHTPLIQLIDRPIGPIQPEQLSIWKMAVLSLFGGIVLYLLYSFTKLVIQSV